MKRMKMSKDDKMKKKKNVERHKMKRIKASFHKFEQNGQRSSRPFFVKLAFTAALKVSNFSE
jgi:hypothetical protein